MFFQNLSPELQQAVKALTVDAEFQKRFSTDEVLDKLDEEKFDPALCLTEMSVALGLPIFVDGVPYNLVTLEKYVYLWCLENPLVKKVSREVEEVDLDLFFYTLENDVNETAVSLATKAIGEIKRRALDVETAKNVALYLISMSFQPLKMFPCSDMTTTLVGNEQPAFDVDWMTSMISKVHEVTGLLPKEIQKLPLMMCCFYYIQWCRQQGVQHIGKRTSEEIKQLQSERTDELIAERFIELGIIKEEDKQDFLNKIKSPTENK